MVGSERESTVGSEPHFRDSHVSGGGSRKEPHSLFPVGHSAVEELEEDALQQLASHASDAR